MTSRNQLPNILTCLNLLCGCVATVSVRDNVILLGGMVFLAAIFDFMDGYAARKLNANSDFGKQLDSLADMVTFGVVPGLILFKLFTWHPEQTLLGSSILFHILKYFPFTVTVFAAFRLAKFNNDPRQKDFFLGLPTPAVGIFVTALPLIIRFDSFGLSTMIINPYVILLISSGLSALMVSEIPLFSLKFRDFTWRANKIQFVFLFLSLALIIFLQFTALPLIVILYILLSIVHYFVLKNIPA